MAEESKLKKLKEEYKKLQEKYDFPSFEELNKDFSIEKIADCETDILIREVRKHISDRLAGYLRFSETLLNPTNAQMFVFSVVKALSSEDKKKLSEIYKELAKNELRLVKTDIEFSEEKEAEFIKNSYNLWQNVKKDFLNILETVEDKWDNKAKSSNGSYFG